MEKRRNKNNIGETKSSKRTSKNKSNIDKRKLVSLVITLITIVTSLALIITIGAINILPFKYMISLILVLLLINFVMGTILLKRKKKHTTRVIINILQVLISAISIFVMIYSIKTYGLLSKMNKGTDKKQKHYSVIVLKESNYKKLVDVEGKNILCLENEMHSSKEAIKKLKDDIDFETINSEDIMAIANTLLDNEVDAILIENSYKELLNEEVEGFDDKTITIHTLSINVEVEVISKDIEVTSEAFCLYISGIDTYGKITSVSRSDVNILAVVNPTTHQILLINIPRDYYVQLAGTTGIRDKLTHAGMYGTEKSVKTVENLLEVDINYYLKVNFTSVIDIINAIGGVNVYSEYAFTSYVDNYNFKKGYNKMNGQQALAFSRERKSFAAGDRMRGKNQQAVIDAIIKKASSPSIVTKFDSLLKSLNGKFQTNMDVSKIIELAKFQISKAPSWTITAIGLTGGDGKAATYTGGSQLLYVMYPSKTSIEDAQEKIDLIISGGKLDGTYQEVTGNIYVPTKAEKKVETPKVEVPEPEKTEEPEKKEPVIKEPKNEKNEEVNPY
ncbi:MAG: LCP family protein [Clostridia bacterium]|nr:LCP family protein [Clostridia bacterium]MDD4375779.1 LCP family protein [Clostridia bacterium]